MMLINRIDRFKFSNFTFNKTFTTPSPRNLQSIADRHAHIQKPAFSHSKNVGNF